MSFPLVAGGLALGGLILWKLLGDDKSPGAGTGIQVFGRAEAKRIFSQASKSTFLPMTDASTSAVVEDGIVVSSLFSPPATSAASWAVARSCSRLASSSGPFRPLLASLSWEKDPSKAKLMRVVDAANLASLASNGKMYAVLAASVAELEELCRSLDIPIAPPVTPPGPPVTPPVIVTPPVPKPPGPPPVATPPADEPPVAWTPPEPLIVPDLVAPPVSLAKPPSAADTNWSFTNPGPSSEIVDAQQKLMKLGYPLSTAHGYYDSDTGRAVTAFQSDRGLVADGVLGPKTKAALAAAVASGSAAKAVSKLFGG